MWRRNIILTKETHKIACESRETYVLRTKQLTECVCVSVFIFKLVISFIKHDDVTCVMRCGLPATLRHFSKPFCNTETAAQPSRNVNQATALWSQHYEFCLTERLHTYACRARHVSSALLYPSVWNYWRYTLQTSNSGEILELFLMVLHRVTVQSSVAPSCRVAQLNCQRTEV